MNNKGSDKNVANIEDDIEILESIVKVHNDFLQGVNKESINEKEIRALEHLLSDYKNMKFNYENLIHDISLIAESLDMQEDSTIEEIALRISEEMYNQQQKDKRIQELEKENEELLEVKISCSAVNIIENLQKENESKQKAYDDCYCEYKKYKQFESIPKQVAIDKIKELDIAILECEYDDDDVEEYKNDVEKEKRILLIKKSALEELLEEK